MYRSVFKRARVAYPRRQERTIAPSLPRGRLGFAFLRIVELDQVFEVPDVMEAAVALDWAGTADAKVALRKRQYQPSSEFSTEWKMP